MQQGAITGHIDVAQVALYTFWLFFAGLILYLLRENKREGYPLIGPTGSATTASWSKAFPSCRRPRGFPMPDGSQIMVPRQEPRDPNVDIAHVGRFQGAPISPTGETMTAGIGPGAWAHRHDMVDVTFDDGAAKIVPLRADPAFFLAWEDPDIRGYQVEGSDRMIAGEVVDAWIDRSEVVLRYLEVQIAGSGERVLLPMNFLRIDKTNRRIICRYLQAAQFALCPKTKHPEQVTLLEEDKICAFYAGGSFYAVARPRRAAAVSRPSGLPGPLPDGETLLWRGAPDWRVLARDTLHVRAMAVYFALIAAGAACRPRARPGAGAARCRQGGWHRRRPGGPRPGLRLGRVARCGLHHHQPPGRAAHRARAAGHAQPAVGAGRDRRSARDRRRQRRSLDQALRRWPLRLRHPLAARPAVALLAGPADLRGLKDVAKPAQVLARALAASADMAGPVC